ncbi:MAG: hypothetical protein KJZ54_07045 [Phycisphaerales bacterium]|nr:hypothetical protein [Phycisphaerales bacterium]
MASVPGFAALMLFIIGAFQVTASLACFIPSFVHDRVPKQFEPVWTFLTKPIYGDRPNEGVIHALAVLSQFVIGIVEALIGVVLLVAAFVPKRRRVCAHAGLSGATLLYGTFMLTMFAMHDKSLPAWNQYPAILAWIGVTWSVVCLESRQDAEK